MTKKLNLKIVSGIALLILAMLFATVTYAAVTAKYVNQATGFSQNYTFFSATTTSATSTNVVNANDPGFLVVTGAKRVDFYFTHGGVATTSTGTSTFSVQVSPDGLNWFNFGRLTQATSTNLQPNASIVGATSTQMFGLDLRTDAFYGVRCIVVEGTNTGASGDGEHTCKAYTEY